MSELSAICISLKERVQRKRASKVSCYNGEPDGCLHQHHLDHFIYFATLSRYIGDSVRRWKSNSCSTGVSVYFWRSNHPVYTQMPTGLIIGSIQRSMVFSVANSPTCLSMVSSLDVLHLHLPGDHGESYEADVQRNRTFLPYLSGMQCNLASSSSKRGFPV